mmetsp:Transcript_69333/g.144778  ORF Transcript_69333/g.144778 Transcript_69333/m.144778 type:complete len:331 (-) Transcript_69333:2547-3539(-)
MFTSSIPGSKNKALSLYSTFRNLLACCMEPAAARRTLFSSMSKTSAITATGTSWAIKVPTLLAMTSFSSSLFLARVEIVAGNGLLALDKYLVVRAFRCAAVLWTAIPLGVTTRLTSVETWNVVCASSVAHGKRSTWRKEMLMTYVGQATSSASLSVSSPFSSAGLGASSSSSSVEVSLSDSEASEPEAWASCLRRCRRWCRCCFASDARAKASTWCSVSGGSASGFQCTRSLTLASAFMHSSCRAASHSFCLSSILPFIQDHGEVTESKMLFSLSSLSEEFWGASSSPSFGDIPLPRPSHQESSGSQSSFSHSYVSSEAFLPKRSATESR